MILAIGLLTAKPVFTLRLVGRLRPLPSGCLPVAVTVWVLSAVPVLASATRPVPRPAVWPAVAVFFVVELAAAWLLAAEARRRGGAASARLRCASAGTGVLGAALLLSVTGAAIGPRALAVLSGVLYLFAFVPPRAVRRIWVRGATHAPMRRLPAVPANEPTRTWQSYCRDATAVLGADTVLVLMPAPDRPVRVVGCVPRPVSTLECTKAGPDQLLAVDDPIDALAGWTRPPVVAVMFAQATDTRFVTATAGGAPCCC